MSQTARLVGDVGGTNARFALIDEQGALSSSRTLRTDDFPSLAAAISTFVDELDGSERGRFSQAAIAVATPVVGDTIKLTNNHWSFSIEDTRAELQLERLHVVNDFTALALSVPHLPASELRKVGGGDAQDNHAIAVIGPGTGLGVSGLIPCGSHWNALQGEGGHVSLGVRTLREFAVYERMIGKFRHVSAERFLSGPGLVNIVSALREIDGLDERSFSPSEITSLGMRSFKQRKGETADEATPDTSIRPSDTSTCEEALQIFCQLLGSCAGNLVLTLGAEGGVFIGGGIVPRLGDFFAESGFRNEFEAKGRLQGYMENVPSYVIHSPYPALVGAAQLLEH
ncbi:MAG: glucokinase [Granulosicoccus sp.]